MKPEFATLYTPFEKDLNTQMPWDVYPRPQFKRQSFINLNGKWNLEIIRKNQSVFTILKIKFFIMHRHKSYREF